jgi:hypothetical protein
MLSPRAAVRSSLAAEQLSHRLVVGDSARPAGSDPLAVRCERGLDLGFFEKRGRGAALDRLEPPQLGQRDDRGRFAAEVDHLIGLVRDAGRLRGHAATVPGPPGHRDAIGWCCAGVSLGARPEAHGPDKGLFAVDRYCTGIAGF